MKNKFVALPILFFLFAFAVPVFALEMQHDYTWGDKLKRGALNIVTSPVEIARQIQVTSNEDSLLEGWTLGLVKGFGIGVLRMGAGFIDLFTFPFNFPDDHKGPLVQPEFVWEKSGVKFA